MSTATLDRKTQERQLTIKDRCDAECSAQAYVKVEGSTGELLFCAHHYNKIMGDPTGYIALTDFASNTIDEREYIS